MSDPNDADLPPLPAKTSMYLLALRYAATAAFPIMGLVGLQVGTQQQWATEVQAIIGAIAAAVPVAMMTWAIVRQLRQELAAKVAIKVAASVSAMQAIVEAVPITMHVPDVGMS